MASDTVSILARHQVYCADHAAVDHAPTSFKLGVFDHQVFPFVSINVVLVYPAPPGVKTTLLSLDGLKKAVSHLLACYLYLTGRFQLDQGSKTYEIGRLGGSVEVVDRCTSSI